MARASTQRKVWETAFLLTAAMDGNFKETFDTAQQVFADLRNEMGETEDFAESTGKAFEAAASAIVASGIYDILGDVVDKYRQCIVTSMEFESMMSSVGAISDASASEMEQLTAKAEELGANTVYTAYESAQAMTYMAQAGWDTVDMISGMDGVMALAAASGEDLAETSSIVADTLSAFKMDASETTRMADVLAQTAARTNTGVLMLGESFKNSAALAGTLGYSIEDVSVMMGLMANAGVKGSVAGTTLKNILNGFVEGATLKSTAFGEVEFSAVNPDGSVKSLSETIEELRGYFAQMSASEKLTNANEIAGMRGYVGLTAVLNATDEQYRELYEDINNCTGAAQEMANVRLDNLKGDIELFTSEVEGLQIAVGDELNPTLRLAVQTGTDFVGWLHDYIEVNPNAVKAVTILGSALAGAAGVFALSSGIAGLVKIIGALGVLANPVVLGATLVAGAIAGVTAAVVLSKDETDLLIAANEDLIKSHEALNESYDEETDKIGEQYDNYFELVSQIELLAEKENKTLTEKQLLLELVEDLNEAVPELNLAYDAQSDSLNMATGSLQDYIEQMYEYQLQQERIERLGDLYAQNREYSSQMSEIDSQLESLYAEEETLHRQIAEEGFTLENWDIGITLGDVQGDIKKLEESKREVQAKYAQSVWEYQSELAASEAYLNAQPAAAEDATVLEAADTAVTNSGVYQVIQNFEGDTSPEAAAKFEDTAEEIIVKVMEGLERSQYNRFRTAYVR